MNYDIRLVVADDHEIFLDGLALMLSRQENIALVGQAADGRELLELVAKEAPDVVMTDIKMPRMDGIAATRELVRQNPDVRIIALSMFDEEDQIVEMLEAGAKGYLLKNADKQEILDAITSVYEDKVYYCKSTSSKLAGMIARSRFNPYKQREQVAFTDREHETITMITQQFTANQIGDRNLQRKRNVEGSSPRILKTMNVRNTAGVVMYALKNNLIREEDLL